MPRNYTTLFDSRYLSRGLAMIESLIKHSSEECYFYILAMDGDAYCCASNWADDHKQNAFVFDLKTLEECSPGMAQCRESRTWQEYCWTCGSNFTEWARTLGNQMQDNEPITYVDSDCYFFSDPKQIFDEIGNRSIGIIPHRFEGPKIATNGKYNVSWVTFRGEVGQRCLSRWAEQCREWCFYRVEPGRFGDQKYLDFWKELYGDEVCEIENIGAGLAPWNLQQYRVTEGPKVDGQPVVFFHFSEYQSPQKLTNYPLRQADKALIYQPYIEALEK